MGSRLQREPKAYWASDVSTLSSLNALHRPPRPHSETAFWFLSTCATDESAVPLTDADIAPNRFASDKQLFHARRLFGNKKLKPTVTYQIWGL